MNKIVNIKILSVIASCIIMLFFMGTNSFASEGYSVGMTLTSSSKINAGETVAVNANLTYVNAGEGIDVIVAKLNYDNSIFETVSQSDFSSNTGWKVTYAPSTNMLVAMNDNKIKNAQTAFSIKLKAKNTTSSIITLTEAEASGGSVINGGTGDISISNTSVNLEKGEDKNYSVGANVSSSSQLSDGQTVTVSLNLNSVDAGNGIDVLVAKLNYDSSIFEAVSQSDFSSNTGWNIAYAPSTNMLVATKDNKITSGETVFTLNLKVKSGFNANSSTISFTEMEASGGSRTYGGTGDIGINSTSITLDKAEQVASVEVNNDQKAEVRKVAEDGSTIIERADGTVVIEKPDGTIVDVNGNIIENAENKDKKNEIHEVGKVATTDTESYIANNDEEDKTPRTTKAIVGSISIATALSTGALLIKKFLII